MNKQTLKPMNTPLNSTVPVEPMIDAREAAVALRLPYYWFADHKMRARYRIPHYLMGGLLRFRRDELHAWAASNPAPQAAHDRQAGASQEDGGAE
jgi:hypothetical protein